MELVRATSSGAYNQVREAIAHNELNTIGLRIRAWLRGEPFTHEQVKMAFEFIRSPRQCIVGLEAERLGSFSKIDEK